MVAYDCRAELFRERGHEVLSSVVQATQMAQADPFDVPEIHIAARRAFERTLADTTHGQGGRILLIRGEAGCGKTHLIRSLRNQTHAHRQGVIAYVHMTSEHGDYRQYLLRQVIRSLSDPYLSDPYFSDAQSPAQRSALDLISDGLMAAAQINGNADTSWCDEENEQELARHINELADHLTEVKQPGGTPRFADVDLNTLRVLLYRQSTRRPIQRRVADFLNGEPLAESDWQKLSALPRECDRGPIHLLDQLARVTWAAMEAPLVICIDQIEASDITGTNHDPFLRAMGTACELSERVPKLMLLLSCLDSAYDSHAPSLITSYRHRIENQPEPVTLPSARSAAEIRQIISRRLRGLYESEGLQHVPPDSVYPMPEDVPEQLDKQQLRKVLQRIHKHWALCADVPEGEVADWVNDSAPVAENIEFDVAADGAADVDRLRIAWNEFKTTASHSVDEGDESQFALLQWALGELPNEFSDGTTLRLAPRKALPPLAPTPMVDATLSHPRLPPVRRLIGLCDRDPRGGGLKRQLQSLQDMRTDQLIGVVRTTPFPRSGDVKAHLEEMKKSGHLLVIAEEAALRDMQALREFLSTRSAEFSPDARREWRTSDQPLMSLSFISELLKAQPSERSGGSQSAASPAQTLPVPTSPPVDVQDSSPSLFSLPPDVLVPQSAPEHHTSLVIGKTVGDISAEVAIELNSLAGHTAIFGGNGSGKTAFALSIVEMLLERGVSVILIDRKGSLATYATDEAWMSTAGSTEEQQRRRRLRSGIDIDLFTPGCPSGRPLIVPLQLPVSLDLLPPSERDAQIRQICAILCDLCSPSSAKQDVFEQVLKHAIEILCGQDAPCTLDDLQALLLTAPQNLMEKLPSYTQKQCEDVGHRLSERRIAQSRLFDEEGERADLPRMLAAAEPGRSRLTIINTQFFDEDAGLIWLAQFITALAAYLPLHPSAGQFEAALMLDDAERYIPARGDSATKAALENLLHREGRTGLSLMLAAHNVADFDMKALDHIATVFAGKVTSERARNKLQPRLGDAVETLSNKAKGEFVMATGEQLCGFTAAPNLIRPQLATAEEIERLARSGQTQSQSG